MKKELINQPAFVFAYYRLPLARQYELQRLYGFEVLDPKYSQLKAAAADRAGVSSSDPAVIIYHLVAGKLRGLGLVDGISGFGRPSIRLEFKSNDDLIAFSKKVEADFPEPELPAKKAIAPNKTKKADSDTDLWGEVKRLAKLAIDTPVIPAAPRPLDNFSFPTSAPERAPAAAPGASSDLVRMIPLDQIYLAPHLFQNREAEYSEESVQRILQAVADGSFQWEIFDPVTLWNDRSKTRLFMISGHSRNEAFRRLASAGTVYKGRSFEQLPSKIFEGSQEEAVKLARNSNNLGTKETDLERAKYYRQLRNNGQSKKEVEAMAKTYEGKNASYILNLAALSPTGSAWNALVQFEHVHDQANKQVITTLADWTGEARRKHPDLTDSHEKEVYEWLQTIYGTKNGQIRAKSEFLARLSTVLDKRRMFGELGPEPLNLLDRAIKSGIELEYDEQLEAARRAYDLAKKQLEEKRKDLISRKATQQDLDRILPQYEAEVNSALRQLNLLANNKGEVKNAARAQVSLFGVPYYDPTLGSFTLPGLGGTKTEVDVMKLSSEVINNLPEIKLSYRRKTIENRQLNSSAAIGKLFEDLWDQNTLELQESFYVLYVNTQLVLIGIYKHTVGKIASTQFDARIIFGAALKAAATGMIIAHNHPSGNPKPSDADKTITKQLQEAGKLLDIKLYDHLIITRNGYFSFADESLL